MDDTKRIIPSLKASIRKNIMMGSLLYIILSGIMVGALSFHEAKEHQDELLREISQFVERQHSTISTDELSNAKPSTDNDVEITIGSLENIPTPFKEYISSDISSGLHTISVQGITWRIYMAQHFFIAQRTEARTEYALQNSLSFILPTLFLVLLLVFSIHYLLSRYFKPLEILGETVKNRKPHNLDPISKHNVFLEIIPFLDAINGLLTRSKEHVENQNLFIASAAHELRTPITAISLQIENLIHAEPTERHERETQILKAMERLRKLVNQLLDMARIEQNNLVHTTKTSFLTTIQTVISDLYPLIEEKKLNINVHQSQDILIDDIREQLTCLVKNAIENAIKFSNYSSEIRIILEKHPSKALFIVENTCTAFPDIKMETLKEPFYKLHQDQEGSGLGLAICQKIAQQFHGTLTLKKTINGHFRFIYSQPLEQKKY